MASLLFYSLPDCERQLSPLEAHMSIHSSKLFSALLCSQNFTPEEFQGIKKIWQRTSRTQTASPLLLNSCKCLGCKSRREKRIQAVVALHAKEEKPLQEKATIYMKHSESPPIPSPSPSKNCLLIFSYCSKMESLSWNSSFSSLIELR